MFCGNCGTQHPDDFNFCQACGNPVSKPVEQEDNPPLQPVAEQEMQAQPESEFIEQADNTSEQPASEQEPQIQPQSEPIQQIDYISQQPTPQSHTTSTSGQCGISITCKKQFGQFLILKPPTIILNDSPNSFFELVWKQPCFIPIPPGVPTKITVQFHYLGKARGAASAMVHVIPGQVAMFSYKTPMIIFSPGKLVCLG